MVEQSSIPAFVSELHHPVAYSYIRMSTHLQLKGDSRRRQLEKSRKYAADHGLTLATESELEDIGVSAFHGKNAREGALGRFLEAVDEGKVPRGSFLLVESLDRITRQKLAEAQSLFLRINMSGINIVTLSDNHIYKAGELDAGDMIISIVSLSRSYEESALKSKRISDRWDAKRRKIREERLTAICPAWLKPNLDQKTFQIIPERAEVVRTIFAECASGMGTSLITRNLHKRRIPTFGKSKGWHESYVARILRNRAVIGEFVAHSIGSDNKRHEVSDVVPNYYPRIVTDDLFHRATAARTARKSYASGPRGKEFKNLFSGLLRCAYCKGSMQFENKGRPPKGASYLVCERARRGLDHPPQRWRYEDFEKSFICFVRELNLGALTGVSKENSHRATLRSKLDELHRRKEILSRERDVTYSLFIKESASNSASAEYMGERLNEYSQRIRATDVEIGFKAAELDFVETKISDFAQNKGLIGELIVQLQDKRDGAFELRAQISAAIRSLVSRVIIAPLGELPFAVNKINYYVDLIENGSFVEGDYDPLSDPDSEENSIENLKVWINSGFPKRRYFLVLFKDGYLRGVYPSKENAMAYDEIIFQTKDGVFSRYPSGNEQRYKLADWTGSNPELSGLLSGLAYFTSYGTKRSYISDVDNY